MSSTNEQVMRTWIDAHFAGRLALRRELQLRQHLPTCEACTRYYRRHLKLELVDIHGLGIRERMARAVGLVRPRSARRAAAILVPAAAVLVGLVLLVVLRANPGEPYAARGVASSQVALYVYRLAPGQSPVPAGRSIDARDELAFGFLNAAGKKRLMVFGVDDTGAIYWYHPAWQSPDRDPAAIPIRGGPGIQELPEAVSHDYRGHTLRIHALFVDQPLTVKQVESLVRAIPSRESRLPVPGSLQDVLALEIRR